MGSYLFACCSRDDLLNLLKQAPKEKKAGLSDRDRGIPSRELKDKGKSALELEEQWRREAEQSRNKEDELKRQEEEERLREEENLRKEEERKVIICILISFFY